MVNFDHIGKEGVVIQFEDIVSLTGYNIANYFKTTGFSRLENIEQKDLLISYFDREEYDIFKWLESYDIEGLTFKDFDKSLSALQPNLLYSHLLLKSAYEHGIRNLKIYSETESDVIRKYTEFYNVPVEYCHTDLKQHLDLNITYYTSIPKNIESCKSFGIPMALVIIDDFMYVKDVASPKYIESLTENNIFVNFTSILGGGFI